MIELNEVVYHWQKGQNNSQIARSLGISRPTVRKYLAAAKAAGLTREGGLRDVVYLFTNRSFDANLAVCLEQPA